MCLTPSVYGDAGDYQGTYCGTVSSPTLGFGKFTVSVSSSGYISGNACSDVETARVSGSVGDTGYFTVSVPSYDVECSGNFSTSGTVSGTCTNDSGDRGSLSGSIKSTCGVCGDEGDGGGDDDGGSGDEGGGGGCFLSSRGLP